MIRNLSITALVLLAAGCASTAPERVAGCTLLGASEITFVPPEEDSFGSSSLFDGRLRSGQVTEDAVGCLVEGVAPTHRVAEAQVQWVHARADAICDGVSHTLRLQPVTAAGEAGYEFSVRVSRDSPASTCEAAAGSPDELDSIGGVDPSSRAMNPPRYPPNAARAQLEGRTVLLVQVDPDGKAGAVLVAKSSGHPILDEAATEAAERWRFNPARTRDGRAVRQLVRIPVNFSLD